MALLITGAGLIGSQIAKLAVDRAEVPVLFDVNPRPDALSTIVDLGRVKIIQGDLLSPYELMHAIKEEGIDRIIHTAANPMLTVGAQKNPYQAIQINIMGTVNVLEAARLVGIRRVVFTSSNVLYNYITGGSDGGKPGKEDAYPRPSTIYATTKLACESLGLNYADSYGVDFVAVRFAAVFGPWPQAGGGGPTQMFRQLIERSLNREPVTMPRQSLEYVYSKDAARGAFLACYAKNLGDRIINIGMGRLYKPEQIVEMVKRVIPGAKIELTDVSEKGPVPRPLDQPMNLSRSREQLGYEPLYDMEMAIEDYVSWYKSRL